MVKGDGELVAIPELHVVIRLVADLVELLYTDTGVSISNRSPGASVTIFQ